jgi:DNA replication protein DnaC
MQQISEAQTDTKKALTEFQKRYWEEVRKPHYSQIKDPEMAKKEIWKNLAWRLDQQRRRFSNDPSIIEFLRFMSHYSVQSPGVNAHQSLIFNGGADLQKGVCLIGVTGSGKTQTMSAVMNFMRVPFISSQKIVEMTKSDRTKLEIGDLFIDDLGNENAAEMSRKTDQPVIGQLLQARYHNQHVNHRKMRTFITTNLTPDMIESRYGERVKSRLFHMTNIMILKTPDFRTQ